MVTLGRILRDYQDAGSVNGLLALWGFVDDTTFLTKAGHVGIVYRVRGVDYEGLSHPQRQALVHRFEAGLRLLDEHCRVYQYLLKRTVAPFVSGTCEQPIANEAIQRRAAYLNDRRHDLYDLSLYLVLLYEAPHVVQRSTRLRGLWTAPREALRSWLSTERTLRLVDTELDRAVGTLHHKAQGFEVQISDFGPGRLHKREAFRFFRELVNYEPAVVDAARLTHDTHLDYFVSDSAVDCHRDHLLVGDSGSPRAARHDVPTSGTGGEELLLESPQLKWPQVWSRDGRFLLYADLDPKTGRDLWVVPLTADRKPRVFVNTNSTRHQVLTSDGSMPRWRTSGEALCFITPGGGLMAAPVRLSGTTLDVGFRSSRVSNGRRDE